LIIVTVQSLIISDDKNEVPILTGETYKQWKERVLLHLGVADLDYALHRDESAKLTDFSTSNEIVLYE